MYIGGAAVILGAGLVLASPAVALLALAFLLIMHVLVVLYEEPSLAGKFGASYERYRASVDRWRIRKPSPTLRAGAEMSVVRGLGT
jgi:protein-S-isoprenylcysteine O-methyltransferase Ste14